MILLEQRLISPTRSQPIQDHPQSWRIRFARWCRFYHNFHSYRWVKDRMVIRITHRLRQSAIDQLNKDFDALLAADRIVQTCRLAGGSR